MLLYTYLADAATTYYIAPDGSDISNFEFRNMEGVEVLGIGITYGLIYILSAINSSQ